ncbi:MAG: ABC transporter substrate-binding protein [Dehalococcoidia bacterium]|nr:ABC transporter substrate-binding protein [Dehalococcoidia bacterium]
MIQRATTVTRSVRRLRLGHSPDSDDAFMFYALAAGKISADDLRFDTVHRDIQTLNQLALGGDLEITAISAHAYAHVWRHYALLTHGASMGRQYGPVVVAPEPTELDALRGQRIAIPGFLTSAYLALRLRLPSFKPEFVPFDQIMPAVAAGDVPAGLLIHEGQLTHGSLGLHRVSDLGEWWHEETGLPLPLGVNAIRRDLGKELLERASALLKKSIRFGLAHRDEALAYAMQFAADIPRNLTDRFVSMYVNDLTLDLGAEGRASVELFLQRGYEAGILPDLPQVEWIS